MDFTKGSIVIGVLLLLFGEIIVVGVVRNIETM
jgi:hypothetical protein